MQDGDLALHQGEHLLQPLHDIEDFQQVLLVDDLHRQLAGDGVGQLARLGDLRDRGQGLGRDLLVQLHVVVELLDHGAGQGLGLVHLAEILLDGGGFGLVIVFLVGEADDGGPRLALDQHLDRAVGQLQQLQHLGDHPHVVDGLGLGIVVGRVLLGGQQDMLVALHHLFEGAHGLVPPDEERADHVREHDDVPQRQHRNGSHLSHNALLDRRVRFALSLWTKTLILPDQASARVVGLADACELMWPVCNAVQAGPISLSPGSHRPVVSLPRQARHIAARIARAAPPSGPCPWCCAAARPRTARAWAA